jgi:hypothetical protein
MSVRAILIRKGSLMEVLGYLAILAILMSALGLWVATQKSRNPAEGFFLGLFFGPLGVLVEALLPSKPNGRDDKPTTVRDRSLDERGQVAFIENRYRDVLEETDPEWERLPYRRKRAIVKSIDRQLMKELRLTATQFADLSAEAKRNVLIRH